MTYLKESTMSSQMSEYDNVPRLSTYYLQNKENTRRAYDPSYELRYNETSPRGNMLPFKGGGGKLACESSQPGEIRGKGRSNGEMLRGVTNSPLRAFPFPNPQKEEKVLDEFYHHQPTVSSQRQQQPIRQESQRVIPKIRPQEYPPSEDLYYDHEMARVPSFFFYLLVFLAEVLLFGVLILSLVWVQFYQGGFAWREDVLREFNLHPVLMITGFIFLMGHAMLTYRLFGCCSKLGAKLLHTILYLMAVPCIVVSTIAVFDNHNLRETPIPNLYSLHSWMGVVTIGLFALQLVVGFFSFWMLLLCEQGTSSFRASLVPIHSSFGLITFMLAIATCVTGLTEKAFFSLKNEAGVTIYPDLPVEAFIINALGIALVALGILIPTLVGIGYFRSSKYRDELSAHL